MSLLKVLPDQCNIFTHYHAFLKIILNLVRLLICSLLSPHPMMECVHGGVLLFSNISYPWYLEEY